MVSRERADEEWRIRVGGGARVAESRKARLSPRALSDRNYEIRQR